MAALDGLLTFFSWHHALRAETVLVREGFEVLLIPAPRDLSPNCGTALRFGYEQREPALAVLADRKVRIDGMHLYTPELERDGPMAASAEANGAARAPALQPAGGERWASWLRKVI